MKSEGSSSFLSFLEIVIGDHGKSTATRSKADHLGVEDPVAVINVSRAVLGESVRERG